MNELPSVGILAAFTVFSRIGTCLMFMPGLSSPRIPVQARLFVAIALSLAITPLIYDVLRPALIGVDAAGLLRLMGSELLIGALIGLMGRVFFVGLEALGMAMSFAIGLTSNLGAPVNEDEPLPAIAAVLTLGATALMFLTDLHLEVFKALAASYTNVPIGGGYAPQSGLVQLVDMTGRAFMVSLRIVSPFLVLSVLVNFAVGLTNRLVPNVQVFFLSSPFLILGGLTLLYVTVKPLLQAFINAFGQFLVSG